MLKTLTAAILLVIVMSGCQVPTIPQSAYHWTGFVIVWAVLIALSAAITFLVFGLIWYRIIRKLWFNDWFAFYVRRHKIETDKLRDGYALYNMNDYWKRQTFKYRLRNIKDTHKGNCNNPIHKTK